MPSSFGQITSQAFNARGKWTSALSIYQKNYLMQKICIERERERKTDKDRDREGKGEGL